VERATAGPVDGGGRPNARIMVRRVLARVRVGIRRVPRSDPSHLLPRHRAEGRGSGRGSRVGGQRNSHQQQPNCAKRATRWKGSTENEG